MDFNPQNLQCEITRISKNFEFKCILEKLTITVLAMKTTSNDAENTVIIKIDIALSNMIEYNTKEDIDIKPYYLFLIQAASKVEQKR